MSNEPDKRSEDGLPDFFGKSASTQHEQARLEATALVASRVSREESHIIVRRAALKAIMRESIIAILVICVALLAYRNFTENQRVKTAILRTAQVNCKQYHDAAIIPLAKGSTTTGEAIIADFRNSYYGYQCQLHLGELPKPDQRIVPYLNKDAGGK